METIPILDTMRNALTARVMAGYTFKVVQDGSTIEFNVKGINEQYTKDYFNRDSLVDPIIDNEPIVEAVLDGDKDYLFSLIEGMIEESIIDRVNLLSEANVKEQYKKINILKLYVA